MAVTITANDDTAIPKLFRVIGSFTQLAGASVLIEATVTTFDIVFPSLTTIQGVVGLTVRTVSTGAIRTNVGMAVSISGNTLTIADGTMNLDADTARVDVLVWGKAKLA